MRFATERKVLFSLVSLIMLAVLGFGIKMLYFKPAELTGVKPVESSSLTNVKTAGITVKEYDDVRLIFGRAKVSVYDQDLSGSGDLLRTLTFNEDTKWPDKSMMPSDTTPESIMETGKDPGLKVREVHKKGLTGKGVTVAIIDQPLYDDHPEYIGKFAAYKDFDCNSQSSMHGPGVMSLLVGENIGTAPDAKVYYAAVPSWLADAKYYADALNWIVEENRKLPEGDKIRAVSVSAAPSGKGSLFVKNNDLWDKAVELAEQEGILVLDCTQHHGIIGPCYVDMDYMEDVSKCTVGFPGISMKGDIPDNIILVPCSLRTTAEEYKKGDFSYQYTGRGGLSWSIPYCTGVLALGWQQRPELTSADMVDILFQTAYLKDNCRIINPEAFMEGVKEYNR